MNQQNHKTKRSESQKEFNLRSQTKPIPMQTEEAMDPTPVTRRQRLKRQLSVVDDQVKLYDIADDILNMQTSATIAQILHYPNQRRNLAKILRRNPQPPEVTTVHHVTKKDQLGSGQMTTVKCHVQIKGNPVIAILDSGTAVSIITNKLRRKLNLNIDALSISLQVIESPKETLLLGTD